MKKKVIWIAVCALVLWLAAAVGAAAADPSGDCGENVRWSLAGDGTLKITGEGDMTDYVTDGEPASPFAALRGKISAVEIGEGVTSVGDNAFYEHTGITGVTLPDGLERIGDGAFYYCRELKEIAVPDSVTVIRRRAFRSCLALETISLPEGVERIGEKAFEDTAWYAAQPDGPVYLNRALLNYKGEMPRQATVAVKEGTLLIADSAFWSCSQMVGVTLPEGLLYIGESAFWECDGLTELSFPEGMRTIGERAFYCCRSLRKAELPRGLTVLGDSAFSGCKALKSVFVPDSVTEIGAEAIPAGTTVVGYTGTYAQQYCAQMGLSFKVRNDQYAPETTTAPEGQRALAQRRKDVGAVVACVAAGVLGIGAAVGLYIIRSGREDEDDEPVPDEDEPDGEFPKEDDAADEPEEPEEPEEAE